MKKRFYSFILFVAVFLSLLVVPASASSYPDVQDGSWYAGYVERCTAQGIINGYEDGTYRPDGYLRRGEFIKMLSCSAGFSASGGSGAHWAEPYWHAMNNRGLLSGTGILCTADSLQTTISRYEMAVLINNFITEVRGEPLSDISQASKVIPDFSSAPAEYKNAVAQVYAKGIINGMTNTAGVVDGSFCGSQGLTRSQAAAVMVRMLDYAQRTPSDLSTKAEEKAAPTPTSPPEEKDASADVSELNLYNDGSNPYRLENAPNGTTPFAVWAQNNGLMNSYGTTTSNLNKMLTGHSDRPYFLSESEAAPYMATVTVNVWRLNSIGEKYASTANVTVHKLLAADVYDIFQQIFNDSEQFPVITLGGLRCNDQMRHAYGAAIDINADYNCQGSGKGKTITCGQGWWPLNTKRTDWAGSLKEASPYSIAYDSVVVRAFKAYGWGWLCQQSSGYADYMHFSFRADGG